jgi:hypothetical protein
MYLRKLTGTEGQIKIPSLGAVVGTISSYSLVRLETAGPDDGQFRFSAALSYFNKHLFENPMSKDIVITFGRDPSGHKKQYRVEVSPTGRMELQEMTLLIEGAKLCPAR